MTATQRSELDRAIERACRARLEVVAHGRRKCDGARIFCVPSQSEANRWHVVTLVGSRLTCDCAAGQHGRICCHRAAVHMEMAVEAARRERLAAEVEAALREERQAQRARADLADEDRWALIEAGQW